MAKVMILGAISLAILFMAATVSCSRFTITIAEDAEINPPTQSCQQQFQQAKQLRSCQQILRQKAQSDELGEDQISQREAQKCCKQLERIQDPLCRCEGLGQIVQQEEQSGQMQERQMQQMVQSAQNLPGLCQLSPQRCDIQTRSLF